MTPHLFTSSGSGATRLAKSWTKNYPLSPFGRSRSRLQFGILLLHHLEILVVHHTRVLNAVEVVKYELRLFLVESVGVERRGV